MAYAFVDTTLNTVDLVKHQCTSITIRVSWRIWC